MLSSESEILGILKQIRHPETGIDLVEAGIIEKISIEEGTIDLYLRFKRMNDPLAASIRKACEQALRKNTGPDQSLNIHTIFPAKQEKTDEPEGENLLRGVRNIIAVASGKGGVGKSTVAVNLAVAMAMDGASVGLVDADIYGPSIPRMFSVDGEQPYIKRSGSREIMIPIEKHGVRIISLGFFVRPEDAVIWRGPMATNAVRQLITNTEWGELDYLFIDMPPGTGDIHLTLVQEVAVTGVVIVSTPQEVALADARKGIAMFTGEKISVPVLGLVENMAWFTPAELPGNRYYIFGKDGCKKLAQEMGITLLGQIPIVQGICEDGDAGRPSALDKNNPAGRQFSVLAENLKSALQIRNKIFSPTKKVEVESKSIFGKLKPKK